MAYLTRKIQRPRMRNSQHVSASSSSVKHPTSSAVLLSILSTASWNACRDWPIGHGPIHRQVDQSAGRCLNSRSSRDRWIGMSSSPPRVRFPSSSRGADPFDECSFHLPYFPSAHLSIPINPKNPAIQICDHDSKASQYRGEARRSGRTRPRPGRPRAAETRGPARGRRRAPRRGGPEPTGRGVVVDQADAASVPGLPTRTSSSSSRLRASS